MAESRMELFIETLTGTAFELSCSPQETIVSIKAKIQYSEGIPVSQQHLIWQSQELNDDLCLQDYSIKDGATLKLVLGIRGGPINTRQDARKVRDLTAIFERSSEPDGSDGRPYTVLIFHDGDRVYMYSLVERGDCTLSPLSGTMSETSSVASIKNVEDVDKDLIKSIEDIDQDLIKNVEEVDQDLTMENAITRGKMAALQERLRALNINKAKKKLPAATVHPPSTSVQGHQEFRLPPLQRTDTHHLKRHSLRNTELRANEPSTSSSQSTSPPNRGSTTTTLDCIASKISTFLLDGKMRLDSKEDQASFLPYLTSAQGATGQRPSQRQGSQAVVVNTGLDSVAKYDPSSVKRLPGTSSQDLSRSFIDLEDWLQARPKTTPEKSDKPKEGGGGKRRIRGEEPQENPLAVEVLAELKKGLMARLHTAQRQRKIRPETRAGIDGDVKALKPFTLQDCDIVPNAQCEKTSPKPKEDAPGPFTATKLPLIQKKKKPCNRCSLCSKKTGLATSYNCRCGKNFCAKHRYAEVHHCSYDYKTEGRRLLQLNNPVVTASKLPKI